AAKCCRRSQSDAACLESQCTAEATRISRDSLDRDFIELIRVDQFERYALVESELTAKPCSRLRRCFRVSWRPRCSRRAIRRRISHDVAAFRIAAQRGHADAIESLEEGTRARLTHDFAPMHELASVHDAGGLILAAWPGVSALGETSAPACRARDCHRDRGRLQLACGFAHLLRTDCDCSAAYGELLGCA